MNIQGNINAIIGTLASLKLDTERNKELKQARQATEAAAKQLEEYKQEDKRRLDEFKEKVAYDNPKLDELKKKMAAYGNPKSYNAESINAASIDRVMNRAIQKKVALKHRTKLKGGRN